MKSEYKERVDEYKNGWLRGTTCFHQKRTVFWQSECGRFLIMKHHGHSEYCGRMTGNSHCGTHYDLFDLAIENTKMAYNDDCEAKLKMWEGRWKKSFFDEVNEAIEKHLNPPTEEEIKAERKAKDESRAKEIHKGRIIIFKERHGDYFYSVETDEKLWDVALYVFLQRYKQEGYWYPTEIDHMLTQEQMVGIGEAEEKIKELNEHLKKEAPEEVKIEIRKLVSRYESALKEYEDAKKYIERIRRIEKTRSPIEAWYFIQERADHEHQYEGFEIDTVIDIDDKKE